MGAQPHHADWTGIGFILEFDDREDGEVAFIIKVPGGVVDVWSLRMAAAAPKLLAALKLCVARDPTLKANVMVTEAIAAALGQDAEGVS